MTAQNGAPSCVCPLSRLVAAATGVNVRWPCSRPQESHKSHMMGHRTRTCSPIGDEKGAACPPSRHRRRFPRRRCYDTPKTGQHRPLSHSVSTRLVCSRFSVFRAGGRLRDSCCPADLDGATRGDTEWYPGAHCRSDLSAHHGRSDAGPGHHGRWLGGTGSCLYLGHVAWMGSCLGGPNRRRPHVGWDALEARSLSGRAR